MAGTPTAADFRAPEIQPGMIDKYLSENAETAFVECGQALAGLESSLIEMTPAQRDMRVVLRAVLGMKEVMDAGTRVWASRNSQGIKGLDGCMDEVFQRIEKLMKYTDNQFESELSKDPGGGPARETQRRAILEFKAIDRLKDFDNERQEYKTWIEKLVNAYAQARNKGRERMTCLLTHAMGGNEKEMTKDGFGKDEFKRPNEEERIDEVDNESGHTSP